MFDFLAALVEEAVGGDTATPYLLGHTFSYPSAQTNINDARPSQTIQLQISTHPVSGRRPTGQPHNPAHATPAEYHTQKNAIIRYFFIMRIK